MSLLVNFIFFHIMGIYIYFDKQYCKDIILIKICNNINKKVKMIFQLGLRIL